MSEEWLKYLDKMRERDARPASTSKKRVIQERSARPTSANKKIVIHEQEARPADTNKNSIRAVHQQSYDKAMDFFSKLPPDHRANPSQSDILYLYNELKLPSSIISKIFNVSDTTMRSWMVMRGITRRKGWESRGLHYNTLFGGVISFV